MVKRSVGADSNPEEKKEAVNEERGVRLSKVLVSKEYVARGEEIIFSFNNDRHHSVKFDNDAPQDVIEKLLKLVDALRNDIHRREL